jgi:hypothetical protein
VFRRVCGGLAIQSQCTTTIKIASICSAAVMENLPLELVSRIIDFTSDINPEATRSAKPRQAYLALVCPQWRDIIEPRTFGKIARDIDFSADSDVKSSRSHHSFVPSTISVGRATGVVTTEMVRHNATLN